MEHHWITFKYEFASSGNTMDGADYIREFHMDVLSEEDDETVKLIGKAVFKIVFLDQANNTGYDMFEIFDTYEYTFRHAQEFFDFDRGELKENIQKFYQYEFAGSNICILERIEIIPEFRGHKIAAKVIKDIIFHFGSSCGLFVIQAFPLQFELNSQRKDDWQEQLQLNSFPDNEKVAFKQLRRYYKNIGFDTVRGYRELLFYNPIFKNARLDAINLEE